ncbi:hypothetical protein HAX54_028198, partial [Datura stramonium]|nr:hypothetical protein [Datura stramonium]
LQKDHVGKFPTIVLLGHDFSLVKKPNARWLVMPGGWSREEDSPPPSNTNMENATYPDRQYVEILKEKSLEDIIDPVNCKTVFMKEGIPCIRWTDEEVDRMNVKENLQYAMIGKFTYGWPDMVKVDLLKDIPSTILIDIVNEATGVVRTEAVRIRYDYMPKYCVECRLQGHDIQECRFLNPIVPNVKVADKESNLVPTVHKLQEGKAKILSSGKVVGNSGRWKVVNKTNKAFNGIAVSNKFDVLRGEEDNNEEHIHNTRQGVISTEVQNKNEQQNEDATSFTSKVKRKETTKEWIERSFGKLFHAKHKCQAVEEEINEADNILATINRQESQTSQNILDDSGQNGVEEQSTLAIIEIRNVVQSDDTHVRRDYLNKVLHEIVSHTFGEERKRQ